jgi:alkanesulfonate monooxygenase SsuD/methylene tetrahydromethanopterin reductase-like flavin-dependent oxidoreductase (luciferase family)
VGAPDEVVEQIQAYPAGGLEELIMQWFDVEDIEGLEFFAEHVLPRLQA